MLILVSQGFGVFEKLGVVQRILDVVFGERSQKFKGFLGDLGAVGLKEGFS